ncbi:12894_t:CDS:2 [Racocetra persica]|uniref:12894_t:CDS:1 n=1 Tax=Racocetra persica TaxID=160502 RepID=A0ACA9M1X1_9GLOM|nr:12894_t:CDS:2 [Racocetra persica]
MRKNLKSEEMVITILEPVKNVISLILVKIDVILVMLNIFRKALVNELVKFTEIEKVKELETVSSELQTLYLKQEKLNKSKFKQLTNKGKIKQIEEKIVDYSSQIEKLNKEIEERKIEPIAEGGFGKVYKAE